MPKYIIERSLPGAGSLTAAELQAIAQKSCTVLQRLGPRINWIESFVTADKIYCVYDSPDENLIRVHAKDGGFPVDSIAEVATVISPATAR
ncbi:MAG: DUF4242 domain-containing protein [Steroidobacteraceae bacterium]